MIRGLIFFLKLAVLVAVAVWLADQPGEAVVTWQGYRLETSFGILLLIVAAVAVIAALTYRFWGGLLRVPGNIGQFWRNRRRQHGYRALTQGMVAVAAGEPQEARRFARKADDLLDDPPLTMLLSAQAAQLNGDEEAAARYFTAMLEDPETRFLGLRGLLRQAQHEGNWQAALQYARQAYDIRPETPWVLWALFDLAFKLGETDTALDALRDLHRHDQLTRAETSRRRGVVLTERARRHLAEGNREAADHESREAVKEAPELPPAAAIRARVQLDGDDPRGAAKTIERAWAEHPHPDLVDLYLEAKPSQDAQQRYQTVRRLADRNAGHRESELALGRLALEAGLWDKARTHLGRAAGERASEGICRLMAELEERQHDDREAARQWLRRAADAPADPAWVCTHCGTVAHQWYGQCPQCDTFDSFAWQSPPEIHAGPVQAIETGAPDERARLAVQAGRGGDGDAGANAEESAVER
ncbi:HemY protein [Limimonas halophila]|uniref:HemY protein n=1 Tax=Limimonas halophila TaxID=1082479 RepID=A0A1G7T6J4_9PROT|nr:heme biosynthesis HemY N-terminal domain-containing protein [Limimonas halophila]SDG30249.1 HemY protein [Limimonas halophila]